MTEGSHGGQWGYTIKKRLFFHIRLEYLMYDPSIFIYSIFVSFSCYPLAAVRSLMLTTRAFVQISYSAHQLGQTTCRQHIPVMGPLHQSSVLSLICANQCLFPFTAWKFHLSGQKILLLTSCVVPERSCWQSSCVLEPSLHVCLLNPNVKCWPGQTLGWGGQGVLCQQSLVR